MNKSSTNMKESRRTSDGDILKNIHKLERLINKLSIENKKLKKSVSDFQNILDQSPVMSAIISLEKRFIRCNSSFCNFLGFPESELTGKSISFITYPEDIESCMTKLLENGSSPITLKKRFLRKDGRVIWGEIKICLIYDINQKPLYFFPVINDIDARENSEKKLIESEERYKRIASGITDYLYTVIIKNGKAIKTLHNEACKLVTGYSPKEFNKDPYLWINMVVPEERELVAERFSNILEGDDLPPLEHRIICKNGSIRWISDTAIPKYDSNGILISYDGVIKDITKRKLNEKYGEISREILSILNQPGNIQDTLKSILTTLKFQTGFDAVGIRLQKGDDYPYIAYNGYNKDFISAENSILRHDNNGNLCLNKEGKPTLVCICGLVISGKTDLLNPYFTAGGSFWTNDEVTKHFSDTQYYPRNRCLSCGYHSVAMVPIRSKDKIIGLIQLNDKSKGRITLDIVEIMEGIASHIGAAILRKQTESKLMEIEDIYRKITSYEMINYN